MIDQPPTTPPSSPPPPPPIGIGRRLLGSIRALSSAMALPSPPPASDSDSEPKLGLSLLLHLKPPDYQSPQAHKEKDKDKQREDAPQPAPTRTSNSKSLLLQPTPTVCSSHHSESESDPTKEALQQQDKVTNQGTLLLVQDDATAAAAARDDHRDDHHCTTAHHQFKVDATTHPSPSPSPRGLTVPDQEEVVGQAAGLGQGTVDTAVHDDLDKPVHQCEELGIAENNDGLEAVEQGVIHQGAVPMDDNAVNAHEEVQAPEEVGQSVIAVDNDQDKAVEQCATCDDLGTRTMENADAVQLLKPRDDIAAEEQEVLEQGHTTHDDLGTRTMENADAVQLLKPRDDIAAEEQEVLELGHTTHDDLGTRTMENSDAVQLLKPRDDIAAEEQEVLEQGHTTHDDLGTRTMGNADAVQLQEALEQGVVATNGGSADATAVDDHDKVAVEQCATYDDFGTTMENDGAKEEVEQGVIDQGDDDNAVKDHEALLLLSAVEGTCATTDDIAVEDQEKIVDQCTTYDDLGTTMENCDVVDVQQVVEQGVVNLTMDNDDSVEEQKVVVQNVVDLTMDNDDSVKEHKVVEEGVVDLTMDNYDPVEDHKVLEQSIIDGTDDIALEEQEKVLERCSRATKEYTVKEKDMVMEQGVLEPTYVDLATIDHDKLTKQGTIAVPMDDIVVKEDDKAVVQYPSDAIVTIKDESPVEEHDTVGNQGVIDRNDRTKDDIDVEGHGYVKEQVIIDDWGTSSDATALEDQKNGAELCIGDEHIAGKDMDGVHAEGNLSEQSTGDKQGATQSDFTVEEHKDAVERVCHEWGAPEDDRAMDDAAYQGTREISSSEVVSGMVNGSYGGMVKKDKVYQPVRYPQKPRKLNCPFYMTKGSCSYGPSCHFNHPQQHKAKTNDSWHPSEQGNHGATEILELNRLGLPIREGARNCVFYMRNGACGYGKNCHFNHPDHVIDAQFNPPTGWEDNALQTEKSSDHTLDETSHMKKPSDDATIDDRPHLKKSSDCATVDDPSYSKKSSDHDKSYSKKSSDHDISYSKKSSDHDTSSSSGVLPPNILRMLLPPQKVLSSTEGKAKKNSDWSSASDGSDGCCSADSSDGPLCKQEEQADYPERPGRPECPFYERYGDCKFASACKYHHSKQSKDKEEVNYPERPGRADCPFYMRFGDCKFASACKYHHPKDKDPERHVPQQAQYPERPGQPDCRYYLQFGKCKYLSACIFHHPKDRLAAGWNPSDPAHSDQTGPECPFYMKAGKCQFGSACEFLHPKDIHSTTEEAFGQRTGSGLYDNSTRSENGVEQQEETRYPERPGEPECSHYMRQGYCKFQMNCKYHHPADRLSKKPYDSTYR